ncbi:MULTISPECIES: NAD(P)/FAD-dependent oxidoreductase [unclassified Luteococcus]|uniref:NAD(P)/FAD-dependent oxidoreductase n=1 Tax=unclassified Luteococcus TaxID=2639923 RepID=UPI00313D13AC
MKVVIVGGGLAGFTTAQELRKLGSEAEITIIDPEGLPYDRPPLSKEFLTGQQPAEKLPFVPQEWYEENGVTMITGRATAIDGKELTVTLADGQVLEADEIVLAMGGRPRPLPIPGGELPGICTLVTRSQASQLREQLTPGRRICIIGAGLIGSEVASTAVAAGCDVTLVSSSPVPGVPLWGRPLAERLHQMHTDKGIRVINAVPHEVEQAGEGFRVHLSCEETVEADTLLASIGTVNECELAETAGVTVDGGIIVDQRQQTSIPHVWAVGDVARMLRPDGSVVPGHGHWETAMHSGQRLAAVLTGGSVTEPAAPWMWSDRHGVHAEAVGGLAGGQLITREVDGVPVASFNLDIEGRMVGAAAIDGGNTVRAARRIIDRGIIVDPEKLADASIDLKKLTR